MYVRSYICMSANCELPLRDVCMRLGETIAMCSTINVNGPDGCVRSGPVYQAIR
jgi:hypothetical protein